MEIWSFRYKDKTSLANAIKYMKNELGWKVKMYNKSSTILKSYRMNVLPKDRPFVVCLYGGHIDLRKQSIISGFKTFKMPIFFPKSQVEALNKGLVGALFEHFEPVPRVLKKSE